MCLHTHYTLLHPQPVCVFPLVCGHALYTAQAWRMVLLSVTLEISLTPQAKAMRIYAVFLLLLILSDDL